MLLNVGGISNVSAYIPPCLSVDEDERFVGFDCGPGMLYYVCALHNNMALVVPVDMKL